MQTSPLRMTEVARPQRGTIRTSASPTLSVCRSHKHAKHYFNTILSVFVRNRMCVRGNMHSPKERKERCDVFVSNNSNLWMLPHAAGTSRPIKILQQNKTARQTKSLNALWKALSSYIKFNMSSTAAKPQGFSLCWNFEWSTRDVKIERERKKRGWDRNKRTEWAVKVEERPSPGLVI